MVTPPEIEARILRLYHAEKWLIGIIAQQLHVHYSVVGRVLAQAGLPRHVTAVPHWSDGCSRWPAAVYNVVRIPKLLAAAA